MNVLILPSVYPMGACPFFGGVAGGPLIEYIVISLNIFLCLSRCPLDMGKNGCRNRVSLMQLGIHHTVVLLLSDQC